MTFNERLAADLDRLAQLLELTGKDRFRVNAHAKAARVVGDLSDDLEPIAADRAALQRIDGIGKGLAEKISAYHATGVLVDLEELLAEVPPGLLQVLAVPGLGPKTVAAMWREIGVTSVDELRDAIDSGEILKVPRMGQKAADKIRQSLVFAEDAGKRLQRGIALPIAERFVEVLRSIDGVERVAFAGSLRRGKETIGDVDLLAVCGSSDALTRAQAALTGADGVVQVIADGAKKTSVRVTLPDSMGRWKGFAAEPSATVQVDLRIVPRESWGAAIMYFTGSKEHNVRLRERALARDLTLNEYGLFPEDRGTTTPPQERGVEPIASEDEASVYERLGLPCVPPELR
ncbi:MAG: nucleotidyltransferase domain-containing protein, partial [Planctomycetota bacterium]